MAPSTTVLVQLSSLALGGTQLNAIDLAHAVERYGYHSVIFGPRDTLPPEGPSVLDVAVTRGMKIETYERASGVLISGATELRHRAQAVGADIIHVYGADAEPRSAFWGPCRTGRRPFVHTVYEMAIPRHSYRNTSLVIGTEYLRDDLAKRPGPTTLISPPVDLSWDQPDPVLAKQFRSTMEHLGKNLVVIVSRLDRSMKAYPVEIAIHAMQLLAHLDTSLVIVGTGTEKERLMEIGRAMNQTAGKTLVQFTGAMADPRPAYAGADVVLGMGGSAARSLAFGRPLVVQGERGTSEVFSPDSSASLFRRSFWNPEPHQDAPERLAGILETLLNSPRDRDELGLFGRDFAAKHFGLEAMTERLAAVYDRSRRHYGIVPWLRDVPREAPELMRSVHRRLDPAIARLLPRRLQ